MNYKHQGTSKQVRKHRFIARQLRAEHPDLFGGLFDKDDDYYDEYLQD